MKILINEYEIPEGSFKSGLLGRIPDGELENLRTCGFSTIRVIGQKEVVGQVVFRQDDHGGMAFLAMPGQSELSLDQVKLEDIATLVRECHPQET